MSARSHGCSPRSCCSRRSPAGDFTVRTAPRLLDPWLRGLPEQELGRDLIAEGHTIPIARVQAMHQGKRPACARRAEAAVGQR